MISAILAIISIFPLSFLMYAMSERMVARHESRVGKQIAFRNFIWQTWVDARLEIKNIESKTTWILYAFQLSIVGLIALNFDYLIFIYLAVSGYLLIALAHGKNQVTKRIESDGQQVRFAVSSAIAILCLFGCFTISKTTNMSSVSWNFGQLLFVIPFQLSGMILFGEHPFQGMLDKKGWLQSARFYVWSMLTAKLFLGGGEYFFDFHLKATILYLGFRICGIYFPRFHQKDLLRISILYLFPITGVLWLIAMLGFALFEPGGARV